MKKITLLLGLSFSLLGAKAQQQKEVAAIKDLCGCYEVKFMYAEIFPTDTSSKFSKPYKASGLEWVVPEEFTDKKMVLQHLLVISDSMIIKHWREDWEFEKKDWWAFDKNATWNHVNGNKDVKGEWTQTVWEVDDAPRYQGSSKWISNNGQYYWENTTDAPLPRREYTKRKDYNVLKRTNKIIITDTGWVHEQDNSKIVRETGGKDRVIALEKGYNIYRKTDDLKCKAAQEWWVSHKAFWTTIRDTWATLMKDKKTVHVLPFVGTELLNEKLDQLESEKLDTAALKVKARQLLQQFITDKDIESTAQNK